MSLNSTSPEAPHGAPRSGVRGRQIASESRLLQGRRWEVDNCVVSTEPVPTARGWYPSPTHTSMYQWWDGNAWDRHCARMTEQGVPTLACKNVWTRSTRLLVAFTSILIVCAGLLLVVVGAAATTTFGRVVPYLLGFGLIAMALLLPIRVSRQSMEAQPGSIWSCTGLRTYRATSSEVTGIRYRKRAFGTGGLVWTAFVDVASGRGFWILGIIAGSPRGFQRQHQCSSVIWSGCPPPARLR